MVAQQPGDRVRSVLALGERRVARLLPLGDLEVGDAGRGDLQTRLRVLLAALDLAALHLAARDRIQAANARATSPSAMPLTSSGCRPQKSAICSKVRLVLSTSQTAVAFGINGRSITCSLRHGSPARRTDAPMAARCAELLSRAPPSRWEGCCRLATAGTVSPRPPAPYSSERAGRRRDRWSGR